MPTSYDFNYSFAAHDVLENHEKFFVILNQAMADGSFPSLNQEPHTIQLPYYDGQLLPPYSEEFTTLMMNFAKLNNLLSKGLEKVLKIYFNNTFYASAMFLHKTMGSSHMAPFWPRPSLVFLPQINQMLLHDDNGIQEEWLLSHEYIVVIPIYPKIHTIEIHS